MSVKRLSPFIVPVFIPNQGCPHRCVFCEQESITSQDLRPVEPQQIVNILESAIRSRSFDLRRNPQIAFYGGTFTGLPRSRMRSLLEAAAPFLKDGLFRSIRISTRPDALDPERLRLMRDFGVLTVELGVQSLDERVLSLAQRGHTVQDTVEAVGMLRNAGFRVGMQLMPGLPGDSPDLFRATVAKTIRLEPDLVRLYPALPIQGTVLGRWYAEGRFQPLELETAVEICAESCMRFETLGIPVIRLGLMSSPALLRTGRIMGGPWHPAFGFLVRSRMHHKGIQPDLPRPQEVSRLRIRLPQKEIPLLRGYKNRGLFWIKSRTGAEHIRIEADDSVPPGKVKIDKL